VPAAARDRDLDPERQRTTLSEPEEHNPLNPVDPNRPAEPDEERRRSRPVQPDEPEDQIDRRPDKFQKRIAKERAKRSDAEYRAKLLEQRIRDMEAILAQTNSKSLDAHEQSLKVQGDEAQRQIEAAYTVGDPKMAAEWHKRLSHVAVQEEQVRQAKAQPAPSKRNADDFDLSTYQPKTRQWIDRNDWFAENATMRNAAINVHHTLVAAGWQPESKKYFEEVERQVRRLFPHEFEDDEESDVDEPEDGSEPADEDEPPRRRSPVAPPTRGTPPARQPTKPNEVRLTQVQKDFCKANGIKEEAYAAGILKRRQQERAR
jgi:hypothetical protein